MANREMSPNNALGITFLVFLGVYFIPFDTPRIAGALQEAFLMLSDYAREHVLLCLVPAMFIAGAVTVFLKQQAVIRYLGPKAPKVVSYGGALGFKKTAVYVAPVVLLSTVAGLIFGGLVS